MVYFSKYQGLGNDFIVIEGNFHDIPNASRLIKPETITKCLTDKSILNMPQYPPHEIREIRKCFRKKH